MPGNSTLRTIRMTRSRNRSTLIRSSSFCSAASAGPFSRPFLTHDNASSYCLRCSYGAGEVVDRHQVGRLAAERFVATGDAFEVAAGR